MVPYPSMPKGWQWMNRISPTTWSLYGLAGSQLSDRGDVYINVYGTSTVPVSTFIVDSFGYEWSMIWWCVAILFAYCAFFRSESGGGSCMLQAWSCRLWSCSLLWTASVSDPTAATCPSCALQLCLG